MAAPKPHFAYSLTPLALAGLGWDMGMLILILYNVFAVPVSICFDLEVPPTHPWFWFDLVFDIVFLTDCFLVNFNTAVMTEAGHLSYDHMVIAKDYFRFWFWVDFPSSIPLSQGFKIAAFVQGTDSSETSQILGALKMIRLARILKLMRLMKAAKIFRILEEELDINVSVLKLFKMIFSVLFICHLMGCFAYIISTGLQEQYVYGMFRPPEWWGCELRPWEPSYFGQKMVTNTSNFKPTPIIEYELLSGVPRAPDGWCDEGRWIERMSKGWIYLWVLYWTITTMTTIGYGDITPKTPIEVFVTIVVQLFGAVLFGWIIGNIASLVAEFDQFATAYKLRIESIKTYLVHKKVPHEMKRRVRKYCGHYYGRKGVIRETWDMLPPRLRRELLKLEHKEFYGVFTRLNVQGCDELLHRLAECVRPLTLTTGTYFVDAEKDPCTEIAFVNEGEIAVLPRAAASRSSRSLVNRKTFSQASPFAGLRNLASGRASQDQSLPVRPSLQRQESSGIRMLAVKRAGSWFGHDELLGVYDEAQNTGIDSLMTADVQWRNTYKARATSELLLLVKDDFYLLLDEYPYLRDLLTLEPRVSAQANSSNPSSTRNSATDTGAGSSISAESSSDAPIHLTINTPSEVELTTNPAAAKNPGLLSPIAPTPKGGGNWGDDDAAGERRSSAKSPTEVSFRSEATDDAEVAGGAAAEGWTRRAGGAPVGEGAAPSAARRASSKRLAVARLSKSMEPQATHPQLANRPRSNSSATFCGARCTKSPNSSAVRPAAGPPAPCITSPSRRASWQKLRKCKADAAQSVAALAPRTSLAVSVGGGSSDGGGGASEADWLKQRIASELLGDAPCAPWEIEEDVVFERLRHLIAQASSIVHAKHADAAEGAPSAAAPAAAGEGPFGVLQVLLAMQRSVQDNADMVRAFLDEAEDATIAAPPAAADGSSSRQSE